MEHELESNDDKHANMLLRETTKYCNKFEIHSENNSQRIWYLPIFCVRNPKKQIKYVLAKAKKINYLIHFYQRGQIIYHF